MEPVYAGTRSSHAKQKSQYFALRYLIERHALVDELLNAFAGQRLPSLRIKGDGHGMYRTVVPACQWSGMRAGEEKFRQHGITGLGI